MADPLGMSTNLVKGILSCIEEIKTSEDECKLLASLAEKTLPLLEMHHSRDLAYLCETQATALVREALEEAYKVVKDYYNEAFFSTLLHPESYSLSLKDVTERLDQAIAELSNSFDDAPNTPSVIEELKECLLCPISKEVMRDPVILTESGVAYDRSSITKWLSQGQRYDPITDVELVSKNLVPNPALRNACQILLAQSGVQSSTNDDPQVEGCEHRIESGLYEGHGTFEIDARIIHAYQLLILGPNGVVAGCTLYTGEYFETQESCVEIGGGQWDNETHELSFGDTQFKYHGIVSSNFYNQQRGIQWDGKVSKFDALDDEYDFILNYFPPPVAQGMQVHATIMEMNGELPTTTNNIKYNSKLLLGLERNSNVDGWISFESSCDKHQYTGRVLNGTWDEYGTLQFLIYFSPHDTPLNSELNPTNYEACFKMAGSIDCDERLSCPTFGSTIKKVRNQGALGNKSPTYTPLEGIKFVEYSFIREASTPWYFLHPLPLKLFQMLRSYDLRSLQCIGKANLSVRFGLISYSQHAFGKSLLHLAAEKNHIETIKELIDEGNDVNLLDNNGQSPLHLASSKNSIDVVKELLIKKAMVDLRDKLGKTPLCIAFEESNDEIIKVLLDNGANINLQDDEGGALLHHLANDNHAKILKKVIAYGANIDLQNKDGWTPLHVASGNNSIDVVKELVTKGANIECLNKSKETPLHSASKNGYVSIIHILLENGASKEIKNKEGKIPYDIACTNQRFKPFDREIVEALNALLEP